MHLESITKYLFKWIIIAIVVGILSGLASALFLYSLEFVTNFRELNKWIIWLLPFGGLLIGYGYYIYGQDVVKGNNLILEEYSNPQKKIPFRMAPMVLLGTLITHFFGGSAGREGTAIQMSTSIADQFTKWFSLDKEDRKIILICGISAGFASVFGTPLAGAIFAIEVLFFSKINYKSIFPSFLVAYIAYFTVEFLPIHHTHYSIPFVPSITLEAVFWAFLVGIPFGFAAMLFSRTTHWWGKIFSKYIIFPPLRPFVGGIIIAVAVFLMGTTQFIGLGIPTILNSFATEQLVYVFLLKILFTGFTLGAGFKGGEVTPLFFIGATLGSFLSLYVPLPTALLAGMGFVAVFSGATHTPIACTVMGMELFGVEGGLFIGIACFVSYLFSGMTGIYTTQIIGGVKGNLYKKFKKSTFENL
ncbi:MAG TPA: voltage-gated chloride channel family protein [Flavobacterium sp.]|uniref:voltage-gated chloride channel family protein n=1 Tax=unclassified Flavobacterium TaxID=196869 RepID=UPI000E982EFD|nr:MULTISPECIES: voltage-gated chloride channel family protein [unclassified Flavobacterium]HBI00369.1 chloride channel protein [Flavobacterium sp.]HRE77078.1 voltage-gated chloride channel family protein [Flavobacterium sp.]